MSSTNNYNEWCDKIHHGGLSRCTFCCANIIGKRLKHYKECEIAKIFFNKYIVIK